MGLAGNRDLLERPKIYCYDHGSNNIPTTISIHLKTGAIFVLFFLGGNCSSSEQIAMLIYFRAKAFKRARGVKRGE